MTITVPWAARWSGELSYDPLTVWDGEIHYPDFRENRDEHGYLWRREGARRTGEPQYSQLNAYRQKASMRAPKCQVCGTRLKPGPIRWLLPKKALSITPEGEVTVISPPTCEDCVELARKACPHLRANGSDLLLVKRWHVWGVIGEVFVIEERRGGRPGEGRVPPVRPDLQARWPPQLRGAPTGRRPGRVRGAGRGRRLVPYRPDIRTADMIALREEGWSYQAIADASG
jgi:hypothetical protein